MRSPAEKSNLTIGMNEFRIELTSKHAAWDKYNVRMMCEMQDAAGNRTGFASTCDKTNGASVLEAGPCVRVRLFVYVIPESLPLDRDVDRQPDFAAVLRAGCDGRVISEERIGINPWGGLSLERLFDSAGRISIMK